MDILNKPSSFYEWIPTCKYVELLHRMNPYEHTKLIVFDFPLVADRYVVGKSRITQNKATKQVKIVLNALKNYPLKKKPKGIWVKNSQVIWILTPKNGKVNVTYYVHPEPGGSLPAGLVNWFIDLGPVRSIKKVWAMVESERLEYVGEIW